MELTDQEKERIVAEEKVRHEARQSLGGDDCCGGGGCCGHGHGWHGRSGGFWKGLILGIIIASVCGHFCRRHFGGYGMCGMGMPMGGGCYGAPMTPPPPPAQPSPKK